MKDEPGAGSASAAAQGGCGAPCNRKCTSSSMPNPPGRLFGTPWGFAYAFRVHTHIHNNAAADKVATAVWHVYLHRQGMYGRAQRAHACVRPSTPPMPPCPPAHPPARLPLLSPCCCCCALPAKRRVWRAGPGQGAVQHAAGADGRARPGRVGRPQRGHHPCHARLPAPKGAERDGRQRHRGRRRAAAHRGRWRGGAQAPGCLGRRPCPMT